MLDKLHDAHGATVLRFWAYQTYTDGGGDFSGVDRVIRIAKAAGMRVLPVLEDGPGDCTTSMQVVPKEQCLVNEAQTTARDAQGRSALVDFAADTAAVVRAVDPNHLVTPGTQANGAPGRAAPTSPPSTGSPSSTSPSCTTGTPMTRPCRRHLRQPPVANSPQCLGADAKLGCSFAQLSAINKPPAGRRGGHRRPHRGRPADPRHAARRQDARGVRGGSERLPALARHQGSARPVRDRPRTGDPVLDELADVADGLGPNSY